MAEFPAFPVFTDAYLGDTTHLTTIEHGAYLLLLFVAWRSTGKCLPDDDEKLAKYARMTRGQWARISPTIREFFIARDGSLYQSRLTDEAKHVRQVREKQSAAGKVSALKRKGRHSTDVEQTFNGCATPSPSPTDTEPKGSGADAPNELDPAKVIFGQGRQLLVDGGVKDGNARTKLGQWRRDHGDAALIAALGTCKREGAIDPIAFIEGIFRSARNGSNRNGNGSGSGSQSGWTSALRDASIPGRADDT